MFKNDEKILCLEKHILVTWKIYLFRTHLVSPKDTRKTRTDLIPVIISDSEGIFWFLQFEIFFKVSVSVLPISINNMKIYREMESHPPFFARGSISLIIIFHPYTTSVKWGSVMWQIGSRKRENWPRIWTFLSPVFRKKALSFMFSP